MRSSATSSPSGSWGCRSDGPSFAHTELGSTAAGAIRDITQRAATGRTVTVLMGADLAPTWQTLVSGGWTDIAVLEDGDGATRLELAETAQAWGESALPRPYMTTLLARRHSRAAREHDGPVSLAVPRVGQACGGRALFGDIRGVCLAVELGDDSNAPLVAVPTVPDYLAPSLRLGNVDRTTGYTAAAAADCRLAWAAEAIGAATRCLQEAVAYAKMREQFGRPIGSFQAVKHHLANAHIALEQAETAVLWTAVEPDAPGALDHAFTSCRSVAELCVQVFGGVGFTWELGLHFYLRHVLALAEAHAGLDG